MNSPLHVPIGRRALVNTTNITPQKTFTAEPAVTYSESQQQLAAGLNPHTMYRNMLTEEKTQVPGFPQASTNWDASAHPIVRPSAYELFPQYSAFPSNPTVS